MNITFSNKADMFEAGIFAVLNEKKEALFNQGKKIYNLSVGTPDFKTAPHIVEAVSEAAKDPGNYKLPWWTFHRSYRLYRTFIKRDSRLHWMQKRSCQ